MVVYLSTLSTVSFYYASWNEMVSLKSAKECEARHQLSFNARVLSVIVIILVEVSRRIYSKICICFSNFQIYGGKYSVGVTNTSVA